MRTLHFVLKNLHFSSQGFEKVVLVWTRVRHASAEMKNNTAKSTLVSSLVALVLHYWSKKVIRSAKSQQKRTAIQRFAQLLRTENIPVVLVPGMCILSLLASVTSSKRFAGAVRSLLHLTLVAGYPVAVLQMLEVC